MNEFKKCAEDILTEIQQLTLSLDYRSAPSVDTSLTAGALENHIDIRTADLSPNVKSRLKREFLGYGPLQDLIDDEDITEILVNSSHAVWFEKNGKLHQHQDHFLTDITFRNCIERIAREGGAQPTLNVPFIDGTFKGFRVHIGIAPLTNSSYAMTLRRHPESPWTLDKLQEADWASPSQVRQLRRLVTDRKNILVIGGTGSGKTSVLNAMLCELADNDRCVLIEDTPELKCPNQASLKMLTRKDSQKILQDVDQSDLVRQSLRMRPDRIIMGEIRSTEAKDLLMAFATGHRGCMGTLHADSARQALLRLEMLIQLGAAQWSVQAVRTLILLSIGAIVVVRKDDSGKRKFEGAYRICSLEDCGFILEQIC